MTTSTKIKSPRDQLARDLARFEDMLDRMRAVPRDVDEAKQLMLGMMVADALVLMTRALLIGSDEIGDALVNLDPHERL